MSESKCIIAALEKDSWDPGRDLGIYNQMHSRCHNLYECNFVITCVHAHHEYMHAGYPVYITSVFLSLQ